VSGDPQDPTGGAIDPAAAPAATPARGSGPPLSQEFFMRVNDFIQMANRIERRYDTHHAQLAFLHAFARYSGHHFKTTTTVDDAENRAAFAEYIGGGVKQLILGHLEDMVGGPAVAASGDPASPADEVAPAAPAAGGPPDAA
jgi:hypothetical protein